MARMTGHALRREQLSPGTDAPSRERPLTTFGFPLDLGVREHFSPITRDSLPASGLVTLQRSDSHLSATFYLLQDPSITGFSGAPVFLIAKPFATSAQGRWPGLGRGRDRPTLFRSWV